MNWIDSERFLKHNHFERVPTSDYTRLSEEDRAEAYQASKMRFEAVLTIFEYITVNNQVREGR